MISTQDPALVAKVIRDGGIVAYPTEAVYGLGCDPNNLAAVKRLLQIKQRPADKGLILIAADETQLTPWIKPLTKAMRARIADTWPGPHTWLVPAKTNVSEYLRGNHSNLAVRVTDHALASKLCRLAETALVSTSANLSRLSPATSAQEVKLQFADRLDALLEGELGGLLQVTQIRDAVTGASLRV